jgi:hypothetical protein
MEKSPMRVDGFVRPKVNYGAWILPFMAVAMLVPSQWNTASAQTAITLSFSGSGSGSVNAFSLTGTGTVTPYGPTSINVTGGSTSGSFTFAFLITFADGSTLAASASPTVSGTNYSGTATITGGTGKFAGASGSFSSLVAVTPGSSGTFNFTESGSGTITNNYYFSDLAFAGGFQTTLTLINYSTAAVTCTTNFYSDAGAALPVPFSQGTVSTRTDTLPPGGSIHDQTVASLSAVVTEGWAHSTCTGAVEASLLYRLYTNGVATSEAGVNAETAPTMNFVTFAQTATGVAYANPSTTQSAVVTFTVFGGTGSQLGTSTITLGPLAHGSSNLGPLLGLQSFTGMVEVVSTIPIVSLSLNAEAFPVISSLPPGDLTGGFSAGGGTTKYYFSDLAFAGGFQTTLTLINYSPQTITCTTNFLTDTGGALAVPFSAGMLATRTDVIPPGGSVHDQTIASLTATVTEGWAESSCSGPVEASLLYRLYSNGVATSEAGVNAETATTTKFVTFAQTATGVAYANPSTTQSAVITLSVVSSTGTRLGSSTVTLGPLAHGSSNLGPLLGLQNFTGMVEVTSTIPIVSLSLNAEAFPVISSLPPGDLPAATTIF